MFASTVTCSNELEFSNRSHPDRCHALKLNDMRCGQIYGAIAIKLQEENTWYLRRVDANANRKVEGEQKLSCLLLSCFDVIDINISKGRAKRFISYPKSNNFIL